LSAGPSYACQRDYPTGNDLAHPPPWLFDCSNGRDVDKLDTVKFEFDPQKSETNKAKHGIDFIEAQALWKSKHVLLYAKSFR
jgi:hypothetical protein